MSEKPEVTDPTVTDPDKYRVVFENDRVRVLEYRDEPGATPTHVFFVELKGATEIRDGALGPSTP